MVFLVEMKLKHDNFLISELLKSGYSKCKGSQLWAKQFYPWWKVSERGFSVWISTDDILLGSSWHGSWAIACMQRDFGDNVLCFASIPCFANENNRQLMHCLKNIGWESVTNTPCASSPCGLYPSAVWKHIFGARSLLGVPSPCKPPSVPRVAESPEQWGFLS